VSRAPSALLAAGWADANPGEPAPPSLRSTVIAGLVTIMLAFGGFLTWGFLASLNSAALGAGTVIANSHRKTVQHLEGGIVKELLVHEGDVVRAGQVMLRLEGAQADAVLTQVRSQYWSAMAQVARLRAEQKGLHQIDFPKEMVAAAATNPIAAEAVKTQQSLFDARWAAYEGQIAVQHKQIAQINEEIAANQAQVGATIQRLNYTNSELESVQHLLEKGYERRPHLLELQRSVAELAGKRGELQANIARAKQAIAAGELQIIGLQSTRRSEIAQSLQEKEAALADLAGKLPAARDISDRLDVVAPQDGKIVDLKYFTTGGVIAPGAPILDIVPLNDDLIVECKMSPTDIDALRVGLPATVRLLAYKQRTVPVIDGKVIYVSADRLTDQRTGEPYYVARIRLSRQSLGELKHVELYPGMPVEAMIVTGERRAIDYFLQPITDSMRRAFREE